MIINVLIPSSVIARLSKVRLARTETFGAKAVPVKVTLLFSSVFVIVKVLEKALKLLTSVGENLNVTSVEGAS